MKVVFDNSTYKYDDKFYYWLLKYLKRYLKLSINYGKLNNFQNSINNNKDVLGKFRKNISGKDVFFTGVENLYLLDLDNKKIIQIDPNQKYYGTQIKINTLCKMINYGTLDFQAYPIFTDSFKYIKDNIKTLYLIYKRQQK